MGGWVVKKKTKLMLHSTVVEIKVEVGVELGKMKNGKWKKQSENKSYQKRNDKKTKKNKKKG